MTRALPAPFLLHDTRMARPDKVKNMTKKMPPCYCDRTVVELLHRLNISLAATFYMEGKLIFFSACELPNGQTIEFLRFARNFKRPTGLAFNGRRLFLSTHDQIVIFNGSPKLAASHPQRPKTYDILFQPVASYHTGYLDHHDAAFIRDQKYKRNDQYVSVSTLFSCLGVCDGQHSFAPLWQPAFISQLAPEDRCHLNGMACADGALKYVSAFCQANSAYAWKDTPAIETGCVIDVEKNDILAQGFIMPHSPRIYQDELYLLNSGAGELLKIDRQSGSYQTLTRLPGFTRGLAFYDDYAFIGLSKLRTGNNPIAARLPVYASEAGMQGLKAGIAIYQLSTQRLLGFIEYKTELTEVYDIAVLPGYQHPMIFNTLTDDYRKAFVLPNDNAYWEIEQETQESTV